MLVIYMCDFYVLQRGSSCLNILFFFIFSIYERDVGMVDINVIGICEVELGMFLFILKCIR